MNKLPLSKRAAILRALAEGNSIRGTARMVGVSKTTILKLLVEVGEFCEKYQDKVLRDLPCKRIEADEIWAFVGAKKKNAKREGDGDIWTFTALCADTKLMVSWLVGHRTREHAHDFIEDVAERLAHRVQLTTDGHHMYLSAVEDTFGYGGIDYAQLQKIFQSAPGVGYSPGKYLGATKERVMGNPDPDVVSTSYVERQNLNIRMYSRRHTRLTNAFSKKVENHAYAMALHFMVHNFCRSQTTLTKKANGVHTSPAMAAGLTNHVWKIDEVLGLMEG